MKTLLSPLIAKGVRFETNDDGNLLIKEGRHSLSDADKQALKQNKAELVTYLSGSKLACLSYPQERLWFLDQLGLSFQYHLPGIGVLTGALDHDALKRAIRFLIERHESLRTTFATLDGTPAQRIQKRISIETEIIDISPLHDAEQIDAQQKYVQEFIERPFNLESGPLFRSLLVTLAPQRHVIVLCMHHIVSDGWSMRILLRDMASAYQAYREHRIPDLPPLTIQYCGYAQWQRENGDADKQQAERNYWHRQLSGYRNLDMPLDFIRPAKLSGIGDQDGFILSQPQAQRIKQLCSSRNTTPFSFFTAAVYLLLRKYSGQADFCLGMPTANRHDPDLENIVGFFVNTLILRLNPPDTQTLNVLELMNVVHTTILEAQDHPNLPIEKILEFLQPDRDSARNPVFQVLINYTPPLPEKYEFGNCLLKPSFDFENRTSKFELTFAYSEYSDGRAGISVEYATDLFLPSTINNLCSHLKRIIDSFSEDPQRRIAAIQLLTEYEREQILKDWNRTGSTGEQSYYYHDLLRQRAEKFAGNTAILFERQSLSYAELNRRSDRLALLLQREELQPESLIGLYMPRSVEMIVAILAILKAGYAYLPLDTQAPDERIRLLLTDSGASKLLTLAAWLEKLTSMVPAGCRVIAADTAASGDNGDDNRAIPYPTSLPNHLAYVIYTSGSTGQPKGVMIEHRSLVNHNLAVIDAYQLTPEDRVLQFSSVSFDIFVEELFPTLLAGAAIVLMDPDQFTDARYFQETVRRQKVSILNLPTAYWNTLTEQNFGDSQVRLAVVGGEALQSDMIVKWRINNKHIPVVNTYGPTETTVISTLFRVDKDFDTRRTIPIGTPIANTRVYILDCDGNPLPVGIAGELHIGGAGLARGYLNQSELTREKFVIDPFVAGERMYKTGDTARYLADGNIVFLGRTDHQVKIRGYRVELGEVEQTMAAYPGIEAAVATLRTLSDGSAPQLAAFFTVLTATKVEIDLLRDYLSARLPAYMIPTFLVELKTLPLTATGKIDRQALAQQPLTGEQDSLVEQPQTDIEQEIAQIWRELLNLEKIGADENFFKIGGHSLLSVQLANKINQQFAHANISIVDILKFPTIRTLAKRITDDADQPSSPFLLNLRSTATQTTTFIVPGMPGLSDGYFQLANAIDGYGPVYGLQMRGYAANSQPATSIEAMAAHNIELIHQLKPQGTIRLFAHSYGGTVLYEMLKQLEESNIEIGEVILIDSGLLTHQSRIDKASVLAFCRLLLENAGTDSMRLIRQISTDLSEAPYAQWKTILAEQLQQMVGVDPDHFVKLWHVVETALNVRYDYPHGKLKYRITLVIAEQSKSWLRAKHWAPYFQKIDVIRAKGEHMSIINEPLCSKWLKRLPSPTSTAHNLKMKSAGAYSGSQTILEARELEKKYRQKTVVDGVSFDVKPGICFGLLGPNGAGKTTTVEMLEGIIKPSAGEIYYYGRPIDKEYRRQIGIQFQQTALQGGLTVRETLRFFQKLYPNRLPIAQLIEACALQDFIDQDIGKLSGGQHQRLLLAIALVNDPQLVFLDEPTTGLDPHARREFWELMTAIKQNGKTIILTTHYMEEAEQLCDEIAIMERGRIIEQGAPRALIEQHFDGVLFRIPEAHGLASRPAFPYSVHRVGGADQFLAPNVSSAIENLLKFDTPFEGLQIGAPTLEDLYLKLTGHSLTV